MTTIWTLLKFDKKLKDYKLYTKHSLQNEHVDN